MKNKITASLLSFSLLILPAVVYGAEPLIPECGAECGLTDLILLINNVIKFLLYSVVVPLATLGFVWVGANLIINQNKESAWSDAKERFWDIGKGVAIILGAYVLIKLVLGAFLSCGQIDFMRFIVDLGSCTP